MDALQWMGAVKMRVQTADKNITIIHTTPVHQLMSCEAKRCVFVKNKSIMLTSNSHFQLKHESIIHNNDCFSENFHLLLSSHIKIHPHSAWSVHISLLIQMRLFFYWKIIDRELFFGFFCLLKMLTDGLEWWGLLVDYCDVFISCLDSHSDGTHSLQRIHCWASDGMIHFSKSDEETNSSTS